MKDRSWMLKVPAVRNALRLLPSWVGKMANSEPSKYLGMSESGVFAGNQEMRDPIFKEVWWSLWTPGPQEHIPARPLCSSWTNEMARDDLGSWRKRRGVHAHPHLCPSPASLRSSLCAKGRWRFRSVFYRLLRLRESWCGESHSPAFQLC